MKKVINLIGFWTILLVMCVGFFSCEEEDSGNSRINSNHKIEFYLDGKLLTWVNTKYFGDTEVVFCKYLYREDSFLNLTIYFDKNDPLHMFYMSFNYMNFNDIKVGDDILLKYKNATVSYNPNRFLNDGFLWSSGVSLPDYSRPRDPGTIIIKSIDTKKQIISFEIKNLLVGRFKGFSGESEREVHSINANLEMYYIFDDGKN